MNKWRSRATVIVAFLVSLWAAPLIAQQVVRVYGTTSTGTFLPALVDSSGRLLVSLAGGTITPTEINLPASTCADPALSEVGALTTGIAFTATPSILNCISGTAATTLTGSALTLGNSVALAWSDISISRSAANVLALASGDSFAIGAAPAQTGAIRLENSAWIYARNAANGADVPIIRVNNADVVEFAAANITVTSVMAPTGFTNAYDLGATGAKWKNFFLAGYTEGAEMTAPAAPSANGYRLFAQDNGAGKTQLMVIFSSGAAQQLAIQP